MKKLEAKITSMKQERLIRCWAKLVGKNYRLQDFRYMGHSEGLADQQKTTTKATFKASIGRRNM